jgi:hypothetical protein
MELEVKGADGKEGEGEEGRWRLGAVELGEEGMWVEVVEEAREGDLFEGK